MNIPWKLGAAHLFIFWAKILSGNDAKTITSCPESVTFKDGHPALQCWPLRNYVCYCVTPTFMDQDDDIQCMTADWFLAHKTCDLVNMDLLSVETLEENNLMETFITDFLRPFNQVVFITGGAYSKEKENFYWFHYSQKKEKVKEVLPFNYTNWAKSYTGKRPVSNGNVCVIFNCINPPCKWELADCAEQVTFICEAQLPLNYKFPETKNGPKILKFSLENLESDEYSSGRALKLIFPLYFIIFPHCFGFEL